MDNFKISKNLNSVVIIFGAVAAILIINKLIK